MNHCDWQGKGWSCICHLQILVKKCIASLRMACGQTPKSLLHKSQAELRTIELVTAAPQEHGG